MIGYLVIFIAAVVAFTLVIQGTYKKAPLFAKYPVARRDPRRPAGRASRASCCCCSS